jgi:hypothetical protein
MEQNRMEETGPLSQHGMDPSEGKAMWRDVSSELHPGGSDAIQESGNPALRVPETESPDAPSGVLLQESP